MTTRPSAAAPAKIVRCPACGGPSEYTPGNTYRPFCSARCKLHDLGDWANERFRLTPQDDEADLPAPTPEAERTRSDH